MTRWFRFLPLLLCGAVAFADGAKEVELMELIRSLQQEVRELKSQVRDLQGKPQERATSGLKVEDHASGHPGFKMDQTESWPKAKLSDVMKQVQLLKDQMLQHQKELVELEKSLP